jgi:Ser/Thr protein kinase RdoA (MazF antagonist)
MWPVAGRVTIGAMALAADAGRDDDAARSELACYDIGAVLSLDRLPSGHPAVRKVTTPAGTYLLKRAGRRADIALLGELPVLGAHGVRQPEVIRTWAGKLTSPNGYFLQEFLAGEPELDPTSTQVRAVMRAVGGLHVALGQLPTDYEPDRDSLFVQVTDPDFLLAELPGLVRRYGLATRPADTAIACLAEHRAALGRLPRQLVHGDIGHLGRRPGRQPGGDRRSAAMGRGRGRSVGSWPDMGGPAQARHHAGTGQAGPHRSWTRRSSPDGRG